jgi:hypothetical protein
MMHQLRMLVFAAAAVLSLVVSAPLRAAETASPNDTARFLAGLPPAPDSPLAAMTNDRAWQQHARTFDSAFGRLENRQLARIRAWSAKNLTTSRPTMFYMFSGPDFLYANAFFPNAATYVLSGLEPVGSVPDLTALRGAVAPNLRQLEASLSSILSYSFFITKHMKSDLRAGRVNGTLPILYVFLARSGKTIREVVPVRLDGNGAAQLDPDAGRGVAQGVKITFAGTDGEAKTLYYFSTNLANDGVKSSGFLKFCQTLAPGDSLIKSASYLLHSGGFTAVRDFLLANSAVLVQDDSGVPVAYYDPKKWELQPFGRYLGPISIFPGKYQAKYAVLFRNSRPIDFGIGYRWRPNDSNLLLAVRTSAEPTEPAPEASAGLAPDKGSESGSSQPSVNRQQSSTRQRRARAYESQRARWPFDWFRAVTPPWGRSR